MATIGFPHRVTALILGGQGLTQPPPTEVPPWNDPLLRADWAAFWSLFPIPLTPETKRHFEEINDPMAMAAERIGRIESAYAFDLGQVSVPAMVYCGGDNDPEDIVPTAQALKTELRVIEGCDHFEAFKALDAVMPFALAFLKTVASS